LRYNENILMFLLTNYHQLTCILFEYSLSLLRHHSYFFQDAVSNQRDISHMPEAAFHQRIL